MSETDSKTALPQTENAGVPTTDIEAQVLEQTTVQTDSSLNENTGTQVPAASSKGTWELVKEDAKEGWQSTKEIFVEGFEGTKEVLGLKAPVGNEGATSPIYDNPKVLWDQTKEGIYEGWTNTKLVYLDGIEAIKEALTLKPPSETDPQDPPVEVWRQGTEGVQEGWKTVKEIIREGVEGIAEIVGLKSASTDTKGGEPNEAPKAEAQTMTETQDPYALDTTVQHGVGITGSPPIMQEQTIQSPGVQVPSSTGFTEVPLSEQPKLPIVDKNSSDTHSSITPP